MSKNKKKIGTIVSMLGILFMTVVPISASAASISTYTNYGVACDACGEYDYMELAGFEQVGIGGTLYRLSYHCLNCGAITYQDFYARSAHK